MALYLPMGYHLLLTHKAPEFFIFGTAYHLTEVQFQNQPGLVPIPTAETPYCGFIDTQGGGDSGCRPSLFLTPEDESPLLGSEPAMVLGRSPVRVPFPKELVQS